MKIKKFRVYYIYRKGHPTRKILYGYDEDDVWTCFLNNYLKLNEEIEDFDMEEVV